MHGDGRRRATREPENAQSFRCFAAVVGEPESVSGRIGWAWGGDGVFLGADALAESRMNDSGMK